MSVIAPGEQAELDAETALAILSSAGELGVGRLSVKFGGLSLSRW